LIINIARLTPQKNQELLIRSFADFSRRYPNHKLIILGQGALRQQLETLICDLHMSEKIQLLGTKNFVTPYYAASDLFVLTSHIEGFALVGIEAMACGLPMVSTKTAGPDEYVREGENGFFIQDATVASVVQAMEKAVRADQDLLKEYALHTAINFDISVSIRGYEALWSECSLWRGI
jgi:glycosyltransferase involved in cell wall biosynthesis